MLMLKMFHVEHYTPLPASPGFPLVRGEKEAAGLFFLAPLLSVLLVSLWCSTWNRFGSGFVFGCLSKS